MNTMSLIIDENMQAISKQNSKNDGGGANFCWYTQNK